MSRPVSLGTGACGFMGTHAGYRLIYPDARQGLADAVRWYREQGWPKNSN